MKKLPVGVLGASLALACAGPAWAIAPPTRLAELADLSLEQLTKITVTSASRREERLVEAPASVFVITNEDIRRSGATSLPEALRLAPNLHVARADNYQYAITARGFANVLANKLLVLLDGRTLYTPLFSGVFWEAQDTVLDDIDRIEVISGPGATLWGANAVNGVINIITKPAAATQGVFARSFAGDDERGGLARGGAELPGGGHYRVFMKYVDRDGKRVESGADIGDDSRLFTGGVRADWSRGAGDFTLQLDAHHGEVDTMPMRDFWGASLMGRYQRRLGADSTLQLTAYYDHTDRRHENVFEESRGTLDFEAQHGFRPAPGHTLVYGAGYRHSRDRVLNSANQAFLPPERTLVFANAFVQDEIALAPRLFLTLGLKAERNSYTGTEWLPNARLAWTPAANTLWWAAISRAIRAPSRLDRELLFPGRAPFLLVPSPDFDSEVANVAEVGYRTQVSEGVSFSLTAFHHDYPNLRSIGLVDGERQFLNDVEGRVTGIEGWGSWRLTPTWRLAGGFVLQDIERRARPGRVDLAAVNSLGNDPERTAMLRSSWSPTPRHEVDLAVRHVGRLQAVVPSYTAVDARFAWRVTDELEVALSVQNLLDAGHIEWQNRGVVDRSFYIGVKWRS